MSSKSDILARLRRHKLPVTRLPDLNDSWITYDDPVKQFKDVLTFVGGQALEIGSWSELESAIRVLPVVIAGSRIVCEVPSLRVGNANLATVSDPHELENVDVAILDGEFAVAENGAVWVTNRYLRHRVIYFIAQHLVLVVPRSQIVHNLHQAYERLRFEGASYGLFISGPSKTADIEQSLVIGAHGPRSLTVMLVGE